MLKDWRIEMSRPLEEWIEKPKYDAMRKYAEKLEQQIDAANKTIDVERDLNAAWQQKYDEAVIDLEMMIRAAIHLGATDEWDEIKHAKATLALAKP